MNDEPHLCVASQTQIEQLMPAYLQEMSKYTEVPEDPAGKLRYPYLPHYWQEPDRTPYAITANNKVCGFALVRKLLNPENGNQYHSMAEFYVDPPARRLGIGSEAAEKVMRKHKGDWEVSVLLKNLPAQPFWKILLTKLDPNLTSETKGESLSYELTVD